MAQFQEFVFQYGYIAVFAFLALGIFGLPVPDELIVGFVGYLVSLGTLNFIVAITMAFSGVFIGTIVTFTIGRKIGKPLIRSYGKWIGLTENRLFIVENWFNRYGAWTVTLGYFIPGMRHFICYFSGMSGMELKKYILFAAIGTVTSSIICVTVGYYIGFPFFN